MEHDCKVKACPGNFKGICKQPYLRCEINIKLAFEALKEMSERDKGCQYCVDFLHNTFQNRASHFKSYKFCGVCGKKMVSDV